MVIYDAFIQNNRLSSYTHILNMWPTLQLVGTLAYGSTNPMLLGSWEVVNECILQKKGDIIGTQEGKWENEWTLVGSNILCECQKLGTIMARPQALHIPCIFVTLCAILVPDKPLAVKGQSVVIAPLCLINDCFRPSPLQHRPMPSCQHHFGSLFFCTCPTQEWAT